MKMLNQICGNDFAAFNVKGEAVPILELVLVTTDYEYMPDGTGGLRKEIRTETFRCMASPAVCERLGAVLFEYAEASSKALETAMKGGKSE